MSEKRKSRPPRLTVVESIYHQGPQGMPTSMRVSFSRWLTSEEQPWTRLTVVKPDWERLDIGWLDSKKIAVLSVANKAVAPWGSEADDIRQDEKFLEWRVSATVQVLFALDASPNITCSHHAVILPGESMRLTPLPGTSIFMRAPKTVPIQIHAQPE